MIKVTYRLAKEMIDSDMGEYFDFVSHSIMDDPLPYAFPLTGIINEPSYYFRHHYDNEQKLCWYVVFNNDNERTMFTLKYGHAL